MGLFRSIRKRFGLARKPKRQLTLAEHHRLKIARATLRMPDAMAGVMGGMTKEEAARIVGGRKGHSRGPGTREQYEARIEGLLASKYGAERARALMQGWSSLIYTSYPMNRSAAEVVKDIVRYEGGLHGHARRADATHAVPEPQHGGHLRAHREHGQEWVTCNRCGKQWAVHGSHAEVVSEGDGYCDENAEEEY